MTIFDIFNTLSRAAKLIVDSVNERESNTPNLSSNPPNKMQGDAADPQSRTLSVVGCPIYFPTNKRQP